MHLSILSSVASVLLAASLSLKSVAAAPAPTQAHAGKSGVRVAVPQFEVPRYKDVPTVPLPMASCLQTRQGNQLFPFYSVFAQWFTACAQTARLSSTQVQQITPIVYRDLVTDQQRRMAVANRKLAVLRQQYRPEIANCMVKSTFFPNGVQSLDFLAASDAQVAQYCQNDMKHVRVQQASPVVTQGRQP